MFLNLVNKITAKIDECHNRRPTFIGVGFGEDAYPETFEKLNRLGHTSPRILRGIMPLLGQFSTSK